MTVGPMALLDDPSPYLDLGSLLDEDVYADLFPAGMYFPKRPPSR